MFIKLNSADYKELSNESDSYRNPKFWYLDIPAFCPWNKILCWNAIFNAKGSNKTENLNNLFIDVRIYYRWGHDHFSENVSFPLKIFFKENGELKQNNDIIIYKNKKYILQDQFADLKLWLNKYHQSCDCSCTIL